MKTFSKLGQAMYSLSIAFTQRYKLDKITYKHLQKSCSELETNYVTKFNGEYYFVDEFSLLN